MSTATKERPILFKPDMVRAILDGRKTETRRVVKLDEPERVNHVEPLIDGEWEFSEVVGADGELVEVHRSPYGTPGDVLWVRETWRPYSWHEGEPITVEFKAGGPRQECCPGMGDEHRYIEWEDRVWLSAQDELDAAGVEPDETGHYRWEGESPLKWRPSIHMPKWACRLRLEVEEVRVERVQEITTEEVWAEGVQIPASPDGNVLLRLTSSGAGKSPASYLPDGRCHQGEPPLTEDELAMCHFADLWDEINADQGYPWGEDPYVWVVRFRKVEETP